MPRAVGWLSSALRAGGNLAVQRIKGRPWDRVGSSGEFGPGPGGTVPDISEHAMPPVPLIQRTLDDGGGDLPAGHEPMTPEALIDQYTSWWGNLDEEALAERLFWLAWMSPSHYDFVQRVLDALSDTDRDDVAVAFVDGSRDDQLDEFASTQQGIALLDRLFNELTSGYMGDDEEREAQRIVEAKGRQIPVVTFISGIEEAMIFPFRLPGFTVLNDAPIEAERLPNGNVRVEMPVRVLGTNEFRSETRTLPEDVFLGGLELPPDQVVGVRMYDEGGQVVFLPALGLITLSARTERTIFQKIGEAVVIAGTFGFGGPVVGGAEAATWGARALLWLDRAAMALFVLTTVINEHRGWILENFPEHGPTFLRAVDIANSVAALYGMGRLAYGGYRVISNLRQAFRRWRQEVAARRLIAGDRGVVDDIVRETDQFLESADEARAAMLEEAPAGVSEEAQMVVAEETRAAVGGEAAAAAAAAPGAARSGGGINVLVVGAETADEFAYATAAASRGNVVTVVNPRATPQAEAYQRAGGNFVQGRVEDLPSSPRYQIIREDFPYPLGRAFQPTAEFASARLARLGPGGRWVVVTESPEFATTLRAAAESQGATVTTRGFPALHETAPGSAYPRETSRFALIIEKPP